MMEIALAKHKKIAMEMTMMIFYCVMTVFQRDFWLNKSTIDTENLALHFGEPILMSLSHKFK